MEKKELKELIIRHALDTFRTMIQKQRRLHQEMAADAFEAENEAFELTDDSNKMEVLEDVEELAKITDSWEDELIMLEKTQADINWEVTYGSVIVTNEGSFFVGASIPEFEVLGVKYTGISAQAPLYKELEGKKAGDVVVFRGVRYAIEDVF